MTQNNQRIEETAAAWAVRLTLRKLSDEEQAELDQWLAANQRHAGALLRARACWANIDRVAALSGSSPEPAARPLSSRWTRYGIAASVLLIMLAAGVFLTWPSSKQYQTPVGGLKNVRIADGSHIVLNADTSLRVHLERNERRIELDRGEALFDVAKDPGRPFIVHAGSVSVRAIGTAFAVRSANRQVEVTVTEGVVELVDDAAATGATTRRLTANQRATVVEKHQVDIERLEAKEVAREVAWGERLIDFNGQPLADAVAEINRYNQRRITVDDAALAARPVVGVFRATDPEGFASTVAAALGATSVDQDDAIHLHRTRQ